MDVRKSAPSSYHQIVALEINTMIALTIRPDPEPSTLTINGWQQLLRCAVCGRGNILVHHGALRQVTGEDRATKRQGPFACGGDVDDSDGMLELRIEGWGSEIVHR